MTIVDTNNLAMICFSQALKLLQEKNGIEYEFKEEDLGFFYHIFSRKIFPILTTYKDVVFCFDHPGGKEWRKAIYPLYKENRKPIKFINKNFFEGIRNYLKLFRCKIFLVENCEGDDLIYKLCDINEEEIIVISTDGDFKQLLNFFPYVKIYNPIKMLFLEKNDNILLEKTIIGDTSDNIKGVPRIGKETLKKMLEDKVLWNKKMTPENIEIMETIMRIVDLRKIPQELQKRIEEEWQKIVWNEFQKDQIESFFLKYKMAEIFDEWNETYSKIQLLRNKEFSISSDEELEKMINEL
jgi:5'-3' exonuclease